MIKSFMVMVTMLGGYYVQQEGLPKPELVGERAVEEQVTATTACSTAFSQSYYAAQAPGGLTFDSASVVEKGRGFSIHWEAGAVAQAPALSVDCYTVGQSVVHLAVNGDTVTSYAL